jgi:hypothetical protein
MPPRFVSGHRFSDAATPPKSGAPLGAEGLTSEVLRRRPTICFLASVRVSFLFRPWPYYFDPAYDTIHSECGLGSSHILSDFLPGRFSRRRPGSSRGGRSRIPSLDGRRRLSSGRNQRYQRVERRTPHGPGFLNGRFEYAVDAVPAFVVFQRANTAFGAGVNPVGLKWIFATRGHVAPYLELNGGTLFTTHEVPTGTSTINFTSGAAFGLHFLGEHAWSVDVRYMHISNAGLTVPNPGVNTVQVRLGFGKFFGKK